MAVIIKTAVTLRRHKNECLSAVSVRREYRSVTTAVRIPGAKRNGCRKMPPVLVGGAGLNEGVFFDADRVSPVIEFLYKVPE